MNNVPGSIHSMLRLLGSVIGQVVGGDPRSVTERLVLASVLPILTTTIMWFSRTTVEVADPEQSQWVQLWITQQKDAIRRVRHLFLLSPSLMRGRRDPYDYNSRRATNSDEDDTDERADRFAPPKLTFLPAGGVSAWAWFGFWPVSVSSVDRTQSDRSFDSRFAHSAGYKVTVWFAPSGAGVAKKLLLEGRKIWLAKRAQKTEIWLYKTNHSPACYDIASRKSRPLESVIIEHGIKDAILADTKRFLTSEEWYVRKGIPYRRGYLLFGPPGCGKTSLITALAGSLRLPIVLIPLGSKSIGDEGLFEALSGAPRDSIVLIEDVDCAFRKGDINDVMSGYSRHVTISGLLNAIDGVAAQEGRLIFLTTNRKDRLTEALIRPGRVDVQYHIGYASKCGACELFDQFFPPSSQEGDHDGQKLKVARDNFVEEVETNVHSFAELQGVLMQARDDPALAAEGMCRLYGSEDASSNSFLKPLALKNGLKGGRVSRIELEDSSFQARIAMLEHAAKCEGCTATNCKRAKKAIDHTNNCEKKPRSKCETCTFLVHLGVAHARKCTVEVSSGGGCPVPFCNRIRQQEVKEESAFVESLFEVSSTADSKEEQQKSSGATVAEQSTAGNNNVVDDVSGTGDEEKD